MSGVFYKVTRMDGIDFHSGTVKYEVGKRVRPKPHKGDRKLCGPGFLHAADTPSETLVNGSWPCRLFEVAGTPVVGFDADHPHKGGFRELRVARELEAWRVFGPNGREVVELVERASRMSVDEAERLGAAMSAAGDAAWSAAGDAAWSAAGDAARSAAWGAARSAALDAAWGATRDAAWSATRDAAWSATWSGAGDATGGAAVALVVRDLVSREHFDVLYGPWAAVFGPPEVIK